MSTPSINHQDYTTEDRDDGSLWFSVGEEFCSIVAAANHILGYEGVIENAWHVTLFDPFNGDAAWAICHGRDDAIKLCALHARTAAKAVAS
ncbi:hypothetical protein [Mycolicibacterium sp. XJ1819]